MRYGKGSPPGSGGLFQCGCACVRPSRSDYFTKCLSRSLTFARLDLMKKRWIPGFIMWSAVTPFLFGDAVKDREGAVRQDKAAMENDARWIYNDVPRGFAEAKQSGKPLLVTLR